MSSIRRKCTVVKLTQLLNQSVISCFVAVAVIPKMTLTLQRRRNYDDDGGGDDDDDDDDDERRTTNDDDEGDDDDVETRRAVTMPSHKDPS